MFKKGGVNLFDLVVVVTIVIIGSYGQTTVTEIGKTTQVLPNYTTKSVLDSLITTATTIETTDATIPSTTAKSARSTITLTSESTTNTNIDTPQISPTPSRTQSTSSTATTSTTATTKTSSSTTTKTPTTKTKSTTTTTKPTPTSTTSTGSSTTSTGSSTTTSTTTEKTSQNPELQSSSMSSSIGTTSSSHSMVFTTIPANTTSEPDSGSKFSPNLVVGIVMAVCSLTLVSGCVLLHLKRSRKKSYRPFSLMACYACFKHKRTRTSSTGSHGPLTTDDLTSVDIPEANQDRELFSIGDQDGGDDGRPPGRSRSDADDDYFYDEIFEHSAFEDRHTIQSNRHLTLSRDNFDDEDFELDVPDIQFKKPSSRI